MIKGDQLPITIVLKYFYDVNRFYFVAVAVKFDKKPLKSSKNHTFLITYKGAYTHYKYDFFSMKVKFIVFPHLLRLHWIIGITQKE